MFVLFGWVMISRGVWFSGYVSNNIKRKKHTIHTKKKNNAINSCPRAALRNIQTSTVEPPGEGVYDWSECLCQVLFNELLLSLSTPSFPSFLEVTCPFCPRTWVWLFTGGLVKLLPPFALISTLDCFIKKGRISSYDGRVSPLLTTVSRSQLNMSCPSSNLWVWSCVLTSERTRATISCPL